MQVRALVEMTPVVRQYCGEFAKRQVGLMSMQRFQHLFHLCELVRVIHACSTTLALQ